MSSQAQHSPPRQESTRIRNRNHYTPKDTGDDVITRTSTPSRNIKKNPYALGLDGPPLTSISRKVSVTLPVRAIPPNHVPVVSTRQHCTELEPAPTAFESVAGAEELESLREGESSASERRPLTPMSSCQVAAIAFVD